MTIIGTTFDRIVAGFAMLRSANAVTGAVAAGRQPAPQDLLALGIDPRAFSTIGHG